MSKRLNVLIGQAIKTKLEVGKPTLVGRTQVIVGTQRATVYSTQYYGVEGHIDAGTTPDQMRMIVRSIHDFKDVANNVYVKHIKREKLEMFGGWVFSKEGLTTILRGNKDEDGEYIYWNFKLQFKNAGYRLERITLNKSQEELLRGVPSLKKKKGVAKATPKSQTVKEDKLSLSGFGVV